MRVPNRAPASKVCVRGFVLNRPAENLATDLVYETALVVAIRDRFPCREGTRWSLPASIA